MYYVIRKTVANDCVVVATLNNGKRRRKYVLRSIYIIYKLPHFSLFTFFIRIVPIKLHYMYLNLLCRVTMKNSIQFNSISNSIQIQNQFNSVDILKAYNVRT